MCIYFWSYCMERIIVGVSGASGIILAHKVIRELTASGYFVELVMTKSALLTASAEMGKDYGTLKGFMASFPQLSQESITVHSINNVGAKIASGTYRNSGMIVVPCSMATLAAIAIGLSDNLLRRAADVMLKERRPLVIVPRETPLNDIHLQHMLTISKVGGIILPPVPAWYTQPQSLDDIENFIVGKILDVLKIEHSLFERWKGINATH